MVACPSISETTFRVNVPAQQKGRTGVPKVVEPDGREGSLLEEQCEGSVSEVRRVQQCPALSGEDESLILVKVTEALHFIQLAPEMNVQSLHRRVGEPYRPAAFPGLGLA